jgi:hypothetical protein
MVKAIQEKEDQTELLGTLRNPTLQIIGHPRGRIYKFRLGLTADRRRIVDFGSGTGQRRLKSILIQTAATWVGSARESSTGEPNGVPVGR